VKRFAALPVAMLLAAATVAVWLSTASAGGVATRSICHRTASKSKPYVKLQVTASQLRAHGKHAADIIPAPRGGCPTSVLTAASGGRAFTVAMVGEVESPAGDPTATGTATIRMRAGQGQVCYQLAASNLPTAVAAHIHRGATGVSGPVGIPLKTPNAAGKSSGCTAVSRTLVASILAQPAGFYVNAHTAEFPNGAIRGQLTGTSTAAFGWVVAIDLKGSSEPNATGTAVVRIRKDVGMVCFRLHAANITLPAVAAHIHRGDSTVNGPVVVPFTPPGPDGNSDGCVPADGTLLDQIIADPAGFYVNVHTKEHPAGAIRAQLG
jgi:hypothetical protein